MADTEHRAVADRLDVVDVVLARESKRRAQHLRAPRGGRAIVAAADGGCRGGRTSLKAALKPWAFATEDEDDDGQT